MSGHLALMAKRRPAGEADPIAMKYCTSCYCPVLSAHRGEVTAVGKGEIQSVAADGAVIGKCGACGKRVVWERAAPQR